MLNKEEQKKLLKAFKFDDAKIAEMVDSEAETSIELPKLNIYTDEELNTYKTNLIKQEEAAILERGRDFYAKDLKAKLGINKDGKAVDVVAELVKEHIIEQANIDPKKAKQEWEADKQVLQNKIAELEGKINTVETEKKQIARNTQILQSLPERNKSISDDEYLLIINTKLKVEQDGDKEVYHWDGQPMRDANLNNLSLKDTLAKVWEGREGWKPTQAAQPAGLGFGDSGAVEGFGTIDELYKHMENKGISIGSSEGNKMLQEQLAKNPNLKASLV